jgi:hypothetical protein
MPPSIFYCSIFRMGPRRMACIFDATTLHGDYGRDGSILSLQVDSKAYQTSIRRFSRILISYQDRMLDMSPLEWYDAFSDEEHGIPMLMVV